VTKKLLVALIVLFTIMVGLSACQPSNPETIIKTIVVEKEGKTVIETVVVTIEPTAEVVEEIETEVCCDVFRIGIYEEPVSLNYWNYLGPGSSVWTRYVISDDAAHLFDISDRRFRFVPSLAKDIPVPVDNGDGTWGITVEMVEDAQWSDGEPITAHDVVFTHEVCVNLVLTWYWSSFCAPDGVKVEAEALGDFNVHYTFINQAPNLRNWQFGIGLAPILPAHYWLGVVNEAYGIIEEAEIPAVAKPENCESDGLNQEKEEICKTWAEYEETFDRARDKLFNAEGDDQPVAGGYVIKEWQPGELIRLIANDKYYFRDSEIVEYSDGTWKRIAADGTEIMVYGEGNTEEILHYHEGPYSPEIIFDLYGSQEAAFGALAAGEIDYVLNPIAVPREVRDQINVLEDIKTYINSDYNMFYLAFNMRKYPMSEYEFRQVFDVIIDKELIIREVLGEAVLPMYSTMPETNTFWYNPDLPKEYIGLSRPERVALAVKILKEAGWQWATEPYWDEFVQDIVPGTGLVMPNGEPMPELTILGPGPDFDIVRATFNQWVSEWARELGMAVKSELTGRNAILDSVFVASDYDMYIFGWPLGNPAYPAYYDEFWHSRNCTFETGGINTTCFKNDAYDALVDEFVATGDFDLAQQLIYGMQLILADQRPYIPLYSEKVYDFARENVIFPLEETLGGIESRDGYLTSTQVLLGK